MNQITNRGYAIVHPDDVADSYADSKVPGEFRRLTDALEATSSPSRSSGSPPTPTSSRAPATTTRRSRSVYLVTRGTLTMRFFDAIETGPAPAAGRVAPGTSRSRRYDYDEGREVPFCSNLDSRGELITG